MKLVERFLNDTGQVVQWPSKQGDKLLVLEYLANKFESDHSYSEPEVNAIIKSWHSFGDWPLLRRELVYYGFIVRRIDGSDYRRPGKL